MRLRTFFQLLTLYCLAAGCPELQAAATFTENFGSGLFDTVRWGSAATGGNGTLGVASQRAEFTVPIATVGGDFAARPWRGPLPVDKNWVATLTVNNTHSPAGADANSSIGLILRHPTTDERLFVELYAWRDGSLFRGFLASLESDSSLFGEVDTEVSGATLAYVRLSYNAATKVVTASYDPDGPGATHTFTTQATFGLGGSGGSTANRNWNLSGSNQFTLAIGGFAELTNLMPGVVWADDFELSIPDYVPPAISLSLQDLHVQLSWPAAGSVFKLETASVLTPALWAPVVAIPQLSGDTYTVTLLKPGAPTFWRLSY